jgi:hypothetical protein
VVRAATPVLAVIGNEVGTNVFMSDSTRLGTVAERQVLLPTEASRFLSAQAGDVNHRVLSDLCWAR